MSAISTILTRLRAAIWAIDVRDDIANAIEQCYSDVSNPTLKTEALEAALQNKIDQGEMAALTIGDGTITAAKLASGVIDNTLATSGAAADAKKTGDEIAAVKADLLNIQRLATDTDLNDVVSPGTYALHANSTYTNTPEETGEHGILEVWREIVSGTTQRTFQRVTYSFKEGREISTVWIRSYSSYTQTWTAWIAAGADVSDLEDAVTALSNSAVRYDVSQTRTLTQKETARANIGAEKSLGVVDNTRENLFDSTTITADKQLYNNNASLFDREGWFTSDYISVRGLDKVYITGARVNVVFDSSKQVVSNKAPAISYQTPVIYTVPDDVYYIRLSAKSEEIDNIFVGPKESVFFRIPDLRVSKSQVACDLSDLKLSISGDSVSTYSGYNPTGYNTFYPRGNVDDVELTWWKKVLDKTGMTLLTNASYSGGRTCGTSENYTEPFVGYSDARINALKGANNENPDVIIVFLGTNDWGFDYELGQVSQTARLPQDGAAIIFSTAYSLMLKKMRIAYPDAWIFCVTTLNGRHNGNNTEYPYLNANSNSLTQFNDVIKKVSAEFGAEVVDLERCGINPWNVGSYTVDTSCTHPNAAGHKLIAKAILDKLAEKLAQ